MINYALLYGKTAFTLAKDIGVSRKEADSFIEAYFARYPKVRAFIDDTVENARRDRDRCGPSWAGCAACRTRRPRTPRSASRPSARPATPRCRARPPTSSRRPWSTSTARCASRKLRARLILQIHDELLLEVPEAEKTVAQDLVKRVMEEALVLAVPLVVDARLGRTWAEVH